MISELMQKQKRGRLRYGRATCVSRSQEGDPRSVHIRIVRSGSIEPDAIMFCCGCVATATTTPEIMN